MKDTEIITAGIKAAPGFSRLVWNAALKLIETRNDIESLKKYNDTHRSKGGKTRAELARRAAGSQEAFFNAIESLDIILEAILSTDDQHCLIHSAMLSEAALIADSMNHAEVYSYAKGYKSLPCSR